MAARNGDIPHCITLLVKAFSLGGLRKRCRLHPAWGRFSMADLYADLGGVVGGKHIHPDSAFRYEVVNVYPEVPIF